MQGTAALIDALRLPEEEQGAAMVSAFCAQLGRRERLVFKAQMRAKRTRQDVSEGRACGAERERDSSSKWVLLHLRLAVDHN